MRVRGRFAGPRMVRTPKARSVAEGVPKESSVIGAPKARKRRTVGWSRLCRARDPLYNQRGMEASVVFGLIVGGLALYVVLAVVLARRYRLPDSSMERLILELERPGHHIALIHCEPAHRRFRDPVLLCHGLAANRFNMDFFDDGTGSDRRSFARYLARAGFDTWILETRGHGYASVPRGAHYDADDEVSQDVPAAMEAVLDQTGAERLIWVGHSWGGLLQVLFQARGHRLVDRVAGVVVLGSPGTLSVQNNLQWVRSAGRVLVRMLRYGIPLRAIAHLSMPVVPILAWLVRTVRPRQALMETPFLLRLFASLAEDIPRSWLEKSLAWAETGGFPEEGRFGQIRVPMLLIAGSNDMIAPPAAVKYLADRVGSGDVTFRTMGRADGCTVDYGHGGLLVSREAPDEVYPVVRAWLAARARRTESAGRGGPIAPAPSGRLNGTPVFR